MWGEWVRKATAYKFYTCTLIGVHFTMHLVDQIKVHISYMCVSVCAHVCASAWACAGACMCVCICVCALYLLVLLIALMEVIFSHDSLKTPSFDQHLMSENKSART